MLFKNLKTGNLVSPKNTVTADMMKRSANYELICSKPAEAVDEKEALRPKTAKKASTKTVKGAE